MNLIDDLRSADAGSSAHIQVNSIVVINLFHMDIRTYIARFTETAHLQGLHDEQIEECISYARNLLQKGMPVILDQEHFAHLVGYDYGYILSLTNVSELYYKKFQIPKKNGKSRTID